MAASKAGIPTAVAETPEASEPSVSSARLEFDGLMQEVYDSE